MLIVIELLKKRGKGGTLGVCMVSDLINEHAGAMHHQISEVQGKDGGVIDDGLVRRIHQIAARTKCDLLDIPK